jgi:preprotein translocase subunit YajC
MDLYELKVGDRVRTVDGNIAEITALTEDGAWIRVKYIDSLENAELINTEDLCSENELEELVYT